MAKSRRAPAKTAARTTRTDAAPAAPAPRSRRDGWVNVITGLGDGTRDKRKSASFSGALRMSVQEAEDLYRGDDMAARAVEVLPNEMCREWFGIQIEGDKDSSEAMEARMEELGLRAKIWEALSWERAYGGSAILIGADDGAGANLEKPLNIEGVKRIKYLTTLTPRECIAWEWNEDPSSDNFGNPEIYQLQPLYSGLPSIKKFGVLPRIHHSRLIRFQGTAVSRRVMRENVGWGDSIFVRLQEVLSDFHMGWGGGAALMADFSQAVIKMKGLAELIATREDDVVVKRLQLIDMSRSILRAVVMDADGEEFERKATPMTGYPEMLEKFMTRLSASLGVPVTLFFGESPAGLNATGASELRSFYDHVASLQKRILAPRLEPFVRVMFREKDGATGGKEPENWSLRFNPLYQLDEVQKADVRLKQAQTDQIYLTTSVLTPEETASSRFGGDGYSTETQIDASVRREMKPAPVADPNAPKPGQDPNAKPGDKGKKPPAA